MGNFLYFHFFFYDRQLGYAFLILLARQFRVNNKMVPYQLAYIRLKLLSIKPGSGM